MPRSVSLTGTLPSGVGAATATTAWGSHSNDGVGQPLMELLDAAGDQGEGMPGLAGHDIRGEGHGGGAGRDEHGLALADGHSVRRISAVGARTAGVRRACGARG